MKGLQAGIPIALLAAVAQAGSPIQDNGGNNVAIPVNNFYNEQSVDIENEFENEIGAPGSHHSPPIHARPGAAAHGGPEGAARHPPMAHSSVPRAVRPDDGGSSPSGVPTCSTHTKHIVHTVTQTVPAHSDSVTPYPAAPYPAVGGGGYSYGYGEDGQGTRGPPGAENQEGEGYNPPYGFGYGFGYPAESSGAHVNAPASSPVAHVAQQSSVAHAPATSSVAHVNAPGTSAAHVVNAPTQSNVAASTAVAHAVNAPVSSSVAHVAQQSSVAHAPATSSVAHVVNAPAQSNVAASTAVAHAVLTSTAVHGAHSYNVIPVDVPNASQSSVRIHGSSSATPSSAGPSGVDPNRAHGTFAANPSSSSVAFTGGAGQLAPGVGMATAVCGLISFLAFAL